MCQRARKPEFRSAFGFAAPTVRVGRQAQPNPSLKRSQRQDTRPGLAVRGTFSPARAWCPAVVARLARTLGLKSACPTSASIKSPSLASRPSISDRDDQGPNACRNWGCILDVGTQYDAHCLGKRSSHSIRSTGSGLFRLPRENTQWNSPESTDGQRDSGEYFRSPEAAAQSSLPTPHEQVVRRKEKLRVLHWHSEYAHRSWNRGLTLRLRPSSFDNNYTRCDASTHSGPTG